MKSECVKGLTDPMTGKVVIYGRLPGMKTQMSTPLRIKLEWDPVKEISFN
jgi:hypothetical protein